MTKETIRRILRDSPINLEAREVAKRAEVPLDVAYASLVALEGQGQARVIVTNPHRGRAECLWCAV